MTRGPIHTGQPAANCSHLAAHDPAPPAESGTLSEMFDVTVDADQVHRQVEAERHRLAAVRERLSAASGPAASMFLVWLLWDRIDHGQLIRWWCALFIADLTSVVQTTRYLRLQERPADAKSWLRAQFALQGLAGVIWGSTAFWATSADLTRDVCVILVAVYTVSVVGRMNYRAAILAWTSGVWVTACSILILSGDPELQRLCGGAVILLTSLNFLLWEASEQLMTGLERRFSAGALAESLRVAASRIHELATRDELTGCMNRRQGMHELRKGLGQRITAEAAPLGVLILDIDHFKRINDTHGHPCGDAVLRVVSLRLASQLRAKDRLARIGGEEFMILLPQSDPEAVRGVAERLREVIAANPVAVGEIAIQVTVSIGAHCIDPRETMEQALVAADRALYNAKRGGRNRVISSALHVAA